MNVPDLRTDRDPAQLVAFAELARTITDPVLGVTISTVAVGRGSGSGAGCWKVLPRLVKRRGRR
ncbi:hypothetical protein [Nocardia niigatensis]